MAGGGGWVAAIVLGAQIAIYHLSLSLEDASLQHTPEFQNHYIK